MVSLWAYLHPGFQIITLALGLTVFAMGLRIRKKRRKREWHSLPRLTALHIRLAKSFTGLFAAGYLLGLGGMALALGEPLFGTAHAYFASLTLLLILATAYLGRRLRQTPENSDVRQIHAYCGTISMFLALLVAILGMGLLP
ncbi:MAG: DUF4079 family protein [bacterium]|nr:DUF4079 family protein [bacterium]